MGEYEAAQKICLPSRWEAGKALGEDWPRKKGGAGGKKPNLKLLPRLGNNHRKEEGDLRKGP